MGKLCFILLLLNCFTGPARATVATSVPLEEDLHSTASRNRSVIPSSATASDQTTSTEPLIIETYSLAPADLRATHLLYVQKMSEHIAEAITAMMRPRGETTGTLNESPVVFNPNNLTLTVTATRENQEFVESMLACLDGSPPPGPASNEDSSTFAEVLSVSRELRFRGIRMRLTRVEENDYQNLKDDSATFIIRTDFSSEDVTMVEGTSQTLQDVSITLKDVLTTTSPGEGKVTLELEDLTHEPPPAPGVAAYGWVADEVSGEPIPNAQILVKGAHTTQTVTGQDGRFTISYPARRTIHLTIRAPGHMDQSLSLNTRKPKHQVIRLSQGPSLHGYVRDETSAPVSNAVVNLVTHWGRENRKTAVTDSHGYYFFTDDTSPLYAAFGPRTEVDLSVRHPGFMPFAITRVKWPEEQPLLTQDLLLSKGALVTGRVTRRTGEHDEPASGVAVLLADTPQVSDKALLTQSLTNAEGVYSLRARPRITQYLFAMADTLAPQLKAVTPTMSQPTTVDLEMEEGRTVRGKVRDNRGIPVKGIAVEVEGWMESNLFKKKAVTAADGTFQLQNMPAQRVTLVAAPDGYGRASLQVYPQQSDVELTLTLPIRLQGKVIDAETSLAISGFRIVHGDYDAETSQTMWSEFSLLPNRAVGLGEFNIIDFPQAAGHRKYRVEAAGYKGQVVKPGAFKGGEGATGLTIALEKGAAVVGQVVDDSGQPVAGARIRVQAGRERRGLGKYDHDHQAIVSNQGGHFEVPQVPDFNYALVVSKEKVGFRVLADIAPETTMCVVRLQPYGSLEGYIYKGNSPLPHHTVAVTNGIAIDSDPHIDIEYTAEANERGFFNFPELPPGRWVVQPKTKLGSNEHFADGTRVVIRPGQRAFTALGGEGGARVFGRVTDDRHAPCKDMEVRLETKLPVTEYYIRSVMTSEDGTYEICEVPTGTYSISVSENQSADKPSSGRRYGRIDIQAVGTESQKRDLKVRTLKPLVLGEILPGINAWDSEGQTVPLPDRKRQLMIHVHSLHKTHKQAVTDYLTTVAAYQAKLRARGIEIVVLSHPTARRGETEKLLSDTGLKDCRLLSISFSWRARLSSIFVLKGFMSGMLLDDSGKLLAELPMDNRLRSRLEELLK